MSCNNKILNEVLNELSPFEENPTEEELVSFIKEDPASVMLAFQDEIAASWMKFYEMHAKPTLPTL